MHILAIVLATLALAVQGQNDGSNNNGSGDGGNEGDNTDEIVATIVVVSLVMLIVIALTITMWVCVCCRPEKALSKRLRQTGKWHWKSNLRRAASSHIGLVEGDERKKSLDISKINPMDLGDSKVWRSSENIIMDGSCDDLYTASQQYVVHSMNYSEKENDFQTLTLDETLFENPSSRSRSEAQLSNIVFSNTTGLQAKAMKLDDLSNEKALEYYDLELHTPKNSPRKNKVSSSTGDLPTRPTPSLSDGNLRLAAKQTESPLVSQQQEQIVTVTIEQPYCITENVKQKDDTVNSEQATTRDKCTDQKELIPTEAPSLQVPKDNLRESLDTPDSGVVLNDQEESSTTVSQDSDQSFQQENTFDGASISDASSNSLPHHTTPNVKTSDPLVNTEQDVVTLSPIANDATLWETVADRKKRYLQIVEHATTLRKTSTGDHPTSKTVSSSVIQTGVDSDHGNSEDEESTTTLSSSQPLLNLTSLEEPKPLLDDSSSDSDMEEMQPPLASTKLSPHTVTQTKCATSPLLSDSSDKEDCEMVQPSEVVVHRSSVKDGTQETVQYRASHPPLQRTLNHEQNITPHHTKKRRHKPSLKIILEEDVDTAHHTNSL